MERSSVSSERAQSGQGSSCAPVSPQRLQVLREEPAPAPPGQGLEFVAPLQHRTLLRLHSASPRCACHFRTGIAQSELGPAESRLRPVLALGPAAAFLLAEGVILGADQSGERGRAAAGTEVAPPRRSRPVSAAPVAAGTPPPPKGCARRRGKGCSTISTRFVSSLAGWSTSRCSADSRARSVRTRFPGSRILSTGYFPRACRETGLAPVRCAGGRGEPVSRFLLRPDTTDLVVFQSRPLLVFRSRAGPPGDSGGCFVPGGSGRVHDPWVRGPSWSFEEAGNCSRRLFSYY